MGMFDEVSIACPACHTRNIVQSKAGPCELRTYNEGDVPGNIAEDINGQAVCCEGCDRTYTVSAQVQVVLKGILE